MFARIGDKIDHTLDSISNIDRQNIANKLENFGDMISNIISKLSERIRNTKEEEEDELENDDFYNFLDELGNEEEEPCDFFFDTETTGFKASTNDILQIAYIIADKNGKIRKQQSFLIKKNLNYVIKNGVWHSKNSGITTELLNREGTELSEVLHTIQNDIKICDRIVGFNVSFDLDFLLNTIDSFGEVYSELREKIVRMDRYCVMKNNLNEKGRWQKLTNLYKDKFNEELENSHTALGDTLGTLRIYHNKKI
jgi:DNA polymerase III alpha subunit (gram-positive type)